MNSNFLEVDEESINIMTDHEEEVELEVELGYEEEEDEDDDDDDDGTGGRISGAMGDGTSIMTDHEEEVELAYDDDTGDGNSMVGLHSGRCLCII